MIGVDQSARSVLPPKVNEVGCTREVRRIAEKE